MSTEQIEAFFRHADTDNSGTLTKLEACKVLSKTGLSVTQVNNIFDEVDVSGDGLVTLEELKKSLAKRDPRDVNDFDDHHDAVVMDFDSEDDEDEEGAVASSPALGGSNRLTGQANLPRNHCSKSRFGEAELRGAFKELDKDNSGSITVDELKVVLKNQGLEAKAEAFIKQVDSNKDGKVDFEEFLKMWKDGL